MATNYEDFHQLVEQFSTELSIREICRQEGVSYGSYLRWRRRHGFGLRGSEVATAGLVEVEVTDAPMRRAGVSCVHIEFSNGVSLDRREMAVDALIEFLTLMKPALCLD